MRNTVVVVQEVYISLPYADRAEVQGPAVALVHTKVRLFYPLAHVQWPVEK